MNNSPHCALDICDNAKYIDSI